MKKFRTLSHGTGFKVQQGAGILFFRIWKDVTWADYAYHPPREHVVLFNTREEAERYARDLSQARDRRKAQQAYAKEAKGGRWWLEGTGKQA